MTTGYPNPSARLAASSAEVASPSRGQGASDDWLTLSLADAAKPVDVQRAIQGGYLV